MEEEPKVKIPDPLRDPWNWFQKQFSWLFTLVIGAMLIGFVTMLFMVVQLVIDATRERRVEVRVSQEMRAQTEILERMAAQQQALIEALQKTTQIQRGSAK